MRAIWTGAITFGLVNVPIKLYSATESHDVRMHQVHNRDGGRIRYQRRCEVCGEVVQWDDIDKAYDSGEQTVVLSDEDLESLPVERNREIDVMEFVPSEQLDPIMLQKTYYIGPEGKSTKSYQLLRRTLEETDRTAIVTFTLRQKTRLGALRVRGDVLVLQSLLWDDEVREVNFPELEDRARISKKELEMSAALVDSFSDDFDPSQYTDEYQEELTKLIEAKLEEGQSVDTEATFGPSEDEEEGGQVLDLMDALRRSVEESRKSGKGKAGSTGGAKASSDGSDGAKSASSKSASSKSASSKSGGAKAKSGSSKSGSAKSSPSRSSSSKSTAAKSSSAKSSAKSDSKSGSSKSESSKKTSTRKKPAERKSA